MAGLFGLGWLQVHWLPEPLRVHHPLSQSHCQARPPTGAGLHPALSHVLASWLDGRGPKTMKMMKLMWPSEGLGRWFF